MNILETFFSRDCALSQDELNRLRKKYRLAFTLSSKLYVDYDIQTRCCCFVASRWYVGSAELYIDSNDTFNEFAAPESFEDIKKMFADIHRGNIYGCHLLRLRSGGSGEFSWFKTEYRTQSNDTGAPESCIICLEDVSVQYEKEIAFRIQREKIKHMPEDHTTYYELDLSKGVCGYCYGKNAEFFTAGHYHWDTMVETVADTLVHPDDRERVKRLLKTSELVRLFEMGDVELKFEFRSSEFGIEDGWSRIEISLCRETLSNDIFAYITITDIYDEKGAILRQEYERRELEEREQHYHNAYEELNSTILCGICKFKTDKKLTIIYANEIFYNIFGFSSRQDAIDSGFVNYLRVVPEQDRAKCLSSINLLKERENRLRYIERRIKKDGSLVWVLGNVAFSRRDRCICLSVVDYTEQRLLEEELRIREKDYDAAVSLCMQMLYIYDIKDKTLSPTMNSERNSSPLPFTDVPESTIRNGYVLPEYAEAYRAFFRAMSSGHPSGEAYLQIIDPQTRQRTWLHGKFKTIFDDAGQPLHAILSCMDVTEQREKELAAIMYRRGIEKLPREKVIYYEFNLDNNLCEYYYGDPELRARFYGCGWDELIDYILENLVHHSYRAQLASLFSRENMIELHKAGKTPIVLEFPSCSENDNPIWRVIEADVQPDSFSETLSVTCLIQELNRERSEALQREKYIEELQKQLEGSRLKVAMNQMQPHFLYNALSSIRTIIKVDPDYAYDLIYDFATHLRGCIKAMSSDEPITFEHELSNIKAYLNIEQMRFGKKLKVEYDVACSSFRVLPLSVQPLVENAVRHGIFERGKDGGTVIIRSSEQEDAFLVEVIDDGVGFDVTEVLSSDRDCVGLKNTLFRFKNLMGAKVLIDSVINLGTHIKIIIPKYEELI